MNTERAVEIVNSNEFWLGGIDHMIEVINDLPFRDAIEVIRFIRDESPEMYTKICEKSTSEG